MFTKYGVKIVCSENQMAPRCSMCPKNDDINSNSWCNGACYFDENQDVCRERSK